MVVSEVSQKSKKYSRLPASFVTFSLAERRKAVMTAFGIKLFCLVPDSC